VFQINSTTGVVTVANNTNLVNATHPTIPITISVSGTTPSATPGNFTINVTIAGGPGLALGTYGSTTASGWTTIGPSDGTLPSASFTNIIYVSDSMGSDNRDGSVPTFVDDNDTVQFVVTSANATATAVYKDLVSGQSCTVAVTISTSVFLQCQSRTGSTFSASGVLTKQSGTGDAAITYSAFTLGIHGPVKTLIKGAGGSGPGPYDPDHTGANNGDGTGLGTIGIWSVAGVGSGFALRSGKPDWLLLRMGDTFTGQTIEVAYDSVNHSDNFGKGGFSELEPMVIGSYDEDVPATSPDLPSGARARPIILNPSATLAYAAMQGAGNVHLYEGRSGLALHGAGNYIAIMGIDFYSAQRDPGNGAYIGPTNVADPLAAIDIPGGKTGILIEDVHARWLVSGFTISDNAQNYDINMRRSQADHCYGNRALGTSVDFVASIGGAISPGFNFEENVFDLCGYTDPALTMGDSRSRNVYLQWNSVFGNRRGNTSTRSGSENFQFRSGGVIDDNFTYAGSFGFDVGHPEGDPTLTSSTTVTNNVVTTTDSPFGTGFGIGIQFYNYANGTASNNLITQYDPAAGASGSYAATDALNGIVNGVTVTSPGSGGATGQYGCIGGTGNFTGGGGTLMSTFTMTVGGGGITNMLFAEPSTGGGGSTYSVGDVLTPVSGYPSINTAGTTLSSIGTGGTDGSYGYTFQQSCASNVFNVNFGSVAGVALTGGSGTGAIANFAYSSFSSITRTLNVMTGFYEATGTFTTPLVIFKDDKFTVTGVTPSAYNGTWVALNGVSDYSIPISSVTWSLNTGMDPGAETVPGALTSYTIISTGKNYAPGDVLTASPGGRSGLQITVNSVANLTGWTLTVSTVTSNGVSGLSFTGNTIFNWPPGLADSGTGNVWTPNTFCGPTTAQFTGTIAGTSLTVDSIVTGLNNNSFNTVTRALVGGTYQATGSTSSAHSFTVGDKVTISGVTISNVLSPLYNGTFTALAGTTGSTVIWDVGAMDPGAVSGIGSSPGELLNIATGNLAGVGVTTSSTITSGAGPTWTVSPSQTVSTPTTMYSYTCTPTTVFSHPELTVDTYAALLGLSPANIDGYMNAASANAKWNWDPALTANNGINPYIRHGFGMTP
jgi:hypothetical protein